MKSSLDFVSVCLKMNEVCRTSEDAAEVQHWLLVNSKSKSVRVRACVRGRSCVLWLLWGFVRFKPAHLSLTRSKDPHWPPTHAHTNTPRHTGWPDYRAQENHLQQRLNYTQTSASCWPLLGKDCLLQVTSLTHTCLIQEEHADTIQLVTLAEWNELYVWRDESFLVKITDWAWSDVNCHPWSQW